MTATGTSEPRRTTGAEEEQVGAAPLFQTQGGLYTKRNAELLPPPAAADICSRGKVDVMS